MGKSATVMSNASKTPGNGSQKRGYLQQTFLPKRKLRDAMLIPQAIADSFGGKEAAPHQIAMAIKTSPTSSTWRDLTGASSAYGLTEGSYSSRAIVLTELGRRCVAPSVDGDDIVARNEAALRPQVLRQFFTKYDRSKFPDDRIARNVLIHDLKVPDDRADDALAVVKDNAAYVGILHNTKTGLFVALSNPEPSTSISAGSAEVPATDSNAQRENDEDTQQTPQRSPLKDAPDTIAFRVFITHSKNMAVVEQVKDVLGLYDIDFELAVEGETTAIPVPDKVLDAMRRCSAGVMVVTADQQTGTNDTPTINNNVLIEIGAAFVLYNKKVVLLWDKRLKVPSNLQGLYRCEFEGNELSFAVGTKLAKAVKAFRGS